MIEKIAAGETGLVEEFLRRGNPATATDDRQVAVIQWCAYHGDVSAIRLLLEAGESLSTLGENLDLNGAVFHGHLALAAFLIEQGADVNHPLPGSGESPLHAVFCKFERESDAALARLLLEQGANPNHQTMPGIETGSFMRDCRTRAETPLHRAAAFGTSAAIDVMLEFDANKETKDANGDSPLSWASWHLRSREVLSKLCYGPYSVAV